MSRAALTALLLAAACQPSYLHVFVEGADPELTSVPVDVAVTVAGGGRATRFSYTGRFVRPASGERRVPYSDFLLTVDPSLHAGFTVHVAVAAGNTEWGGDERVDAAALPSELHLPLAPGDNTIGTAQLGDGALESVAQLGFGLELTWPDLDGLAVRNERNPDVPQARKQLVAADPGVTAVRSSSRPVASGAPDLVALSWSVDGTIYLRTSTATADGAPVAVGAADEATVACVPAGGAFDVVVVSETGGVAAARTFAADGSALGPSVALEVSAPVRALVGVYGASSDSFIMAARGDAGSRLGRYRPDGARLAETALPGDVQALSPRSDGARLLVITLEGGELRLHGYDLDDLEESGPAATLTAYTPPVDPRLGRVALGDCVAAWPEPRGDGTPALDLRFRYLDDAGQPTGEAHLVNTGVDGDFFAPTAACFSATRVYLAYLSRSDAGALDGNLRLRRLPSLDLTEGGTP